MMRASAGPLSHAFCCSSCSSWPRSPAGVAEGDGDTLRAASLRNRRENVLRCRNADLVPYPEHRIPVPRRVVDDESALALHRPALEHRDPIGVSRGSLDAHVVEDRGELDVERPVDDDAHRAVLAVRAHQGHRPVKVRIGEARHRDEELVGQIHAGHYGRVRGGDKRFRRRVRPPGHGPAPRADAAARM